MKQIITLQELCGNFAENKDIARDIRETKLKPWLNSEEDRIVLDFKNIDSSTQSFIHAMISDIFQQGGEAMLEKFEFTNCNKAIKSLIGTVINYSLE